jgi:phosphomannomutase
MNDKQFFEKQKKWAAEQIEKYGWYAHYVGGNEYGEGVNFHTHNVLESFKHYDFQIVVAVASGTAHSIFEELIRRIKEGESFKIGQIVSGIVKNYNVKLCMASENNRRVLRIILPEANGELEETKMTNLRYQYNGVL